MRMCVRVCVCVFGPQADEYVVYSPHQQRMRYLVEFTIPDQDAHSDTGDGVGGEGVERVPRDGVEGEESEEEGTDEGVAYSLVFNTYTITSLNFYTVTLGDVKDIADPMNKVKAGLQAEGADVPLQSVHVRAQLIDLAARVVVLQAYKNNSAVPIEAKYVFPLDDMAAGEWTNCNVCTIHNTYSWACQ